MNINDDELKGLYKEVYALLSDNRLKEAIEKLKAAHDENGIPRTALDEIETNYQYMLQYMRQGITDPQQKVIYTRLLRQTFELLDDVYTTRLYNTSAQYYFTVQRSKSMALQAIDYETYLHKLLDCSDELSISRLSQDNDLFTATAQRREETLNKLFLAIWTSHRWTSQQAGQINEYLTSERLSTIDLCLVVSAVTLGLTQLFDANKLLWLFEAACHTHIEVNQRAMIGLAITLSLHHERIGLYPALQLQYQSFIEEASNRHQLETIYLQLLQSGETEKVSKRIREDIFPKMMDGVNKIQQIISQSDESSLFDNDLNPEWEKALETSDFTDRIKEMSELQSAGADVYMSTFEQMKRNVFFNDLYNWFLPFDADNSHVIKCFRTASPDFIDLLNIHLGNGILCNSDKYSFCLLLSMIEPQSSSPLAHLVSKQLKGMKQDSDMDRMLKAQTAKPEVVSRQYIFDLYRFHKLYRYRHDFYNPFDNLNSAIAHAPYRTLLEEQPFHQAIAHFHFDKGDYNQAIERYQSIIQTGEADAEIYQRIAFCYQKKGDWDNAIRYYLQADALNANHIWTLQHLAGCYRGKRMYTEAVELYRQIEQSTPEDTKLMSIIGGCLSETGEYEEALRYFFKADYLKNGSIQTWRAIAWCLFMQEKWSQAEKYYAKISQSHQSSATDFLNIGHLWLVQGEMAKAIESYTHSLRLMDERNEQGVTGFRELFLKDKAILLAKGVAAHDIPLLLDAINA